MKILKRTIMYLVFLTVLLAVVGFLVLLLPVFGQAPTKERQQRLTKSPHYKDGKFVNQEETPVMSADASYWKMLRQQFSGGDHLVPTRPLPVIKRDLTLPVAGPEPRITWFGHSTILVQLAGKNILIDPMFSARPSPFQFIGPKNFPGTGAYGARDMPAIDYLLISHDHFDHLDYQTILELAPRVGHFFVPLGVGGHLEKWGVARERIHELDWWDEVQLTPDLLLAATPARHFSGRGLRRNVTLWASYVLKTSHQAVFLSGDSGYGPHFKAIGDKYGPFALTLLECGQYNSYWPYIHMMPEETAQAQVDLKGEVLIPIHWGKFKLAFHSWTDPVERLTAKARQLGLKTLMPRVGEPVGPETAAPLNRWWQKQSPENPAAAGAGG